MKKVSLCVAMLVLSGCGYSSQNNELIGQIKKISHETPIWCPNFTAVDVSLGILRNGVGSMSTEDLWLYVSDPYVLDTIKKAQEANAAVKINYGIRRISFCVPVAWLTSVEILK